MQNLGKQTGTGTAFSRYWKKVLEIEELLKRT